MADFATNAYTAALFDLTGSIHIGRKPIIVIFPENPEAINFLMNNWEGEIEYQSPTGVPFWVLRGWKPVLEFVAEVKEDCLTMKRQIELLIRYSAYTLEYGHTEEVERVARIQMLGLTERDEPVTWDIETMGLEPDKKHFLSCSFQVGDDEESIWSVSKLGIGEREALVETRRCLESAPYTIGFNSIRFDIPYTNTRLAKYGERPMFLGSHDDASVMYDKMMGRTKRTSLVKAVEEQGLSDDDRYKTPIDWVKWNAADADDENGMAYVIQHSENDIALTRRLYDVTMVGTAGKS